MLYYRSEREERHKDSPFAPFAKEEGFGLWAVYNSYVILLAMIRGKEDTSIENYFTLAEKKARENPEHTETLYQILRKGMHEEAKNHTSILYAITNLCESATEISKHDSLPGSPYNDFLIEVSSEETEDDEKI